MLTMSFRFEYITTHIYRTLTIWFLNHSPKCFILFISPNLHNPPQKKELFFYYYFIKKGTEASSFKTLPQTHSAINHQSRDLDMVGFNGHIMCFSPKRRTSDLLLSKDNQFSMDMGSTRVCQHCPFLFLFSWTFQALNRVIWAIIFLEVVLFTNQHI